MEKKYTPYFAPICSANCLRKAKTENEKELTKPEPQENYEKPKNKTLTKRMPI
jgi:hypothetical protein